MREKKDNLNVIKIIDIYSVKDTNKRMKKIERKHL